MENSLPKGWISISPLAIAEKIRGVSYGKEDVFNENGNGRIPVLRANGIEDNKIKYDDIVYVSSDNVNSNQILKNGDVLIAMSSGSKNLVGKTAQFIGDNKVSFGAFCGVLRPNQNINPKYFGYYFQSKDYRNTISEVAAGTNINNLKNEHFESLRIPIPPLPEQQRIVAKLDELMAKIDRSRARLERIPQILKRFRQSVLSAAVSGKLTEEWRERNGIVQAWKEFEFGECIIELRNGLGKKPNIDPPGIPILRIGALRPGSIDFTDIRYYDDNENNIEAFFLKENDLLFTRYNGSIEFLGVCGMVKRLESNYVYPDKLMRVRVSIEKVTPGYCEVYFQSEMARNEILKYAKSSAGQNGISGGDLKKVKIACPQKKEQEEIIRIVEHLFNFADKIESRYNKAKAQLDKLPQSLLAKAFRGELVPQDEKDEPASVLLQRIQHGNPGKPGKARKPRSYKMGVEPLSMAAEQ